MKPIKFTILFLGVFSLLVGQVAFTNQASAQGTEQSLYAYVYKVLGGPVVISAISPGDPGNSHWLYTIPILGDSEMISALASPDGRWIALIPISQGGWIRLVELATGQTRDIHYVGIVFDFSTGRFWGEFQPVAWSPNSQWLAFSSYTADGMSDVFVYSLADDALTNLSSDTTFQYAVAWSPDSTYLASGGTTCFSAPECDVQIDVFDWPARSRIVSQNPIWTEGPVGTLACQLRWSPDGRYVSFVASCDGASPWLEKDVFLLDRLQGTVTPLTHYTQTAYQDPNAPVDSPLRVGRYDTGWYTADSFFLGALYGEEVSGEYLFRSQIARYDVLTGTQTLLRSDVMGEGWTLNPAQTQVAYRTVSGYPTRTYHGVEVAGIALGALTMISTGPAGCDLAWSPDGATLAYTGRAQPMESCDGSVKAVYFMDSATGQLTQYSPAPVELAEGVRAAGWIAFDLANLPPTLVPSIPVAIAGPDQTVIDADNSGSELVTLDGSASYDPDGSLVDYAWTTEYGVEIATGVTPSIELPVGVHNIILTVTDNVGWDFSDMVTITVEAGS